MCSVMLFTVAIGRRLMMDICSFRGFVLKTKQCPSVDMFQANPIHPETLDWIRGPPIDFMKVLATMHTLQECCEGLLNHKVGSYARIYSRQLTNHDAYRVKNCLLSMLIFPGP